MAGVALVWVSVKSCVHLSTFNI